MSINLNIPFKILWINFVCVVLMLKQICIFFFTAPFWYIIKDVPSWAQLLILIVLWQILLLYTSLVNSILSRYQTYPQTPSYLMEKWFFSTFYKKFSISQFLSYVNFFTFFCILTYFFKTIQFIFIWFLEMHLLFTNMFSHSLFCYHTCNRHCVFDTLRTECPVLYTKQKYGMWYL